MDDQAEMSRKRIVEVVEGRKSRVRCGRFLSRSRVDRRKYPSGTTLTSWDERQPICVRDVKTTVEMRWL